MAVFSRNVPNSAAAVCCCWILVLQIPEIVSKMAVCKRFAGPLTLWPGFCAQKHASPPCTALFSMRTRHKSPHRRLPIWWDGCTPNTRLKPRRPHRYALCNGHTAPWKGYDGSRPQVITWTCPPSQGSTPPLLPPPSRGSSPWVGGSQESETRERTRILFAPPSPKTITAPSNPGSGGSRAGTLVSRPY
eukprot:COSAG01_NODE_1277_length_10932_cov_18.121942_11_plen_189_part_00